MVFTQNQVRHFYVGESVDFTQTVENDLVIKVTSDKVETRTDIVPLDKVEYVKLTKADAYADKGIGAKYIVKGIEKGKSYVIHVEVCNQAGFGDEESFLWFGAYKAKDGDDKAAVAKGLVDSLHATIAKYSNLPTGEAAWNTLTEAQKTSAQQKIGFSAKVDGATITIEPVKPEFILGKSNDRFPLIHVYASPQDEEMEVEWIKEDEDNKPYVVSDTSNTNMVAQMAYFYHKNRGDQYDGALWPNNIPYVDPVNYSEKYDILDIHFYYNSDAENVQKSPKQLTIACPTGSALTALYNALQGKENITDNAAIIIKSADSGMKAETATT